MASPVESGSPNPKRRCPLLFTAAEVRHKKENLMALTPRGRVLKNPLLLSEASDQLKNDEELVTFCVTYTGWLLRYASTKLRAEYSVVEAAVKQCGRALQYASEGLLDDKPLVLTAVLQDGDAVQYASTRLRGDEDVMLAAVQQKGTALMHGTEKIKGTVTVVLAAVTQDGKALNFASEKLQTQSTFVLKAAETYGSALRYANEQLLADKGFVLACVRNHPYALEFAGKFRKDTDVVWAAFAQNPLLLEDADDTFKNDEKTVETLVKQDACALKFASNECKQKLDLVLNAVMKHGIATRFMDPILSDNRRIFELAVQTYPEAVQFASKTLRADADFMHKLIVISKSGKLLQHTLDNVRKHKSVVLQAVKYDASAICYVDPYMPEYAKVAFAAVQNDGIVLRHLSEEFQKNKALVAAALQSNVRAYKYVHTDLYNDPDLTRIIEKSPDSEWLDHLRDDVRKRFSGVAPNC